MHIRLTKDHEDWLQAQVAAGRYASLGEAVADAIDTLKSDEEDLAWAKPFVAAGLAELDRGEAISADEVLGSIEARLRQKL